MPLTKSSDKKSNADLNKNASNDAPKAEARSCLLYTSPSPRD